MLPLNQTFSFHQTNDKHLQSVKGGWQSLDLIAFSNCAATFVLSKTKSDILETAEIHLVCFAAYFWQRRLLSFFYLSKYPAQQGIFSLGEPRTGGHQNH